MKIERLDDGYKLTDLYVTATILCEPGMELVDAQTTDAIKKPHEIEAKKQTMFTVKGDPVRIKQIIDAFFNGKHMVDANNFKTKIKLLKSKIYANF